MKMVNDDQFRLGRETGTNKIYNEISSSPGAIKSNSLKNRDIFLLALAIGYKNNIRTPINKIDRFVTNEAFGKVLPFVVDSLAISKKGDIEVISEESQKLYKIAEEYANGGLNLLKDDYVGNSDEFIEMLRSEIISANKNDKILNKLDELDI